MSCNMNNGMNRNMCRNVNEQRARNNMTQNRQGCGCGNGVMTRGNYNNMPRDNHGINNMNRNTCGCRTGNADRERCMKMDGCDIETEPVDRMAPGMAFVPWQKWEDIYCMEKSLERGTIFEQLDKPFLGGRMK